MNDFDEKEPKRINIKPLKEPQEEKKEVVVVKEIVKEVVKEVAPKKKRGRPPLDPSKRKRQRKTNDPYTMTKARTNALKKARMQRLVNLYNDRKEKAQLKEQSGQVDPPKGCSERDVSGCYSVGNPQQNVHDPRATGAVPIIDLTQSLQSTVEPVVLTSGREFRDEDPLYEQERNKVYDDRENIKAKNSKSVSGARGSLGETHRNASEQVGEYELSFSSFGHDHKEESLHEGIYFA